MRRVLHAHMFVEGASAGALLALRVLDEGTTILKDMVFKRATVVYCCKVGVVFECLGSNNAWSREPRGHKVRKFQSC